MKPLLASSTDGIRILTLNRPERRNALDSVLAAMLVAALREADEDPAIGAVLIAAQGPGFCAGADLGEFKGDKANPEAQERRSDLFLELQLVFGEIDVPVVCAVVGPAIGAGAGIAVAADFTVLGETARLAYPEVLHGMVPSLMISHLQRRTGRKQAFELLALGETLGAGQALAAGLVNRVVPDQEALATALAIAKALASRDRCTLRQTKRLLVDLAEMPLQQSLQAARQSRRKVPGAAGH